MRMKSSKNLLRRFLSSILCMTLIVAIALFTTGCNDSKEKDEFTQFTLTVVDGDGEETKIVVHTDKETVGEALLELDLIAGDESEYGLFVKTVNGITADYDKDGTYWAFYINGEYAQSGVDSTVIENDGNYAFKVEK